MTELEMLGKYAKYLNHLQARFDKYFEAQKDYIHCKEGCAACCQKGEYPISELELKYLLFGFQKLDKETREKIRSNVDQLKNQKERFYQCPFLINNKCSVYEYRALICRSHGLLFYVTNQDGTTRNKIPACSSDGLNYSEVYDAKTGTMSAEKWEQSGIKTEPKAYNISREVLLSNEATKELGLDFGESKALIDWF